MTLTIRSGAVRIAAMITLGALSAFSWPAENSSVERRSAPEETLFNSSDAISVDLLRHPIGDKARRMLHKALDAMNAGDLDAARSELLEMREKYPSSAVYAHSVLGVIYIRTNDFENAVSSFEVAASLLPHDAMTHYNFALALACAGIYEHSEQEVRRALDLDPKNGSAQTLLNVLLRRKPTGDSAPPFGAKEISSGGEGHSRD